MTGTIGEKTQITVTLGCEPRLLVTIVEKFDGGLFIDIKSEDPDAEVGDLDGFFFNFTDDATMNGLHIWPDENQGTQWAPVTDIQMNPDAVDSLSNGAQLAETYDAGIQFGLTPDSTQGHVSAANFTMWSENGPLSIEDIDLDSLAAVVNSDTENGIVKTVSDSTNSGDGYGEEEHEDDECAFLIEGPVNTEVVLTQLENGDIRVDLQVLEGDDPDATGQIGDINGLFFNVADDSLLNGMTVTGDDVTGSQFAAGSVNNLGNGVNMHGTQEGETSETANGFDAGIAIGHTGIGGGDDIRATSFTLSHPDGLSLEDFSGEFFGLRLTSVGDEGSDDREDSLKLIGQCEEEPQPPICDDQYYLNDVMALMTQPMHDELAYEMMASEPVEEMDLVETY
ncbi:hypothetical protein [Ruegeria marina]|uniref:Uncharacterized protein n=1 Tax=Ruegeria marina TaxID=639004 RepID=A0A1G6J0X7_9RHOB|nr:hypothetical protein [Ruegeria marina]SDC12361.1 hypothetical protein SAMN04488239_101248 [Ruegeria marina]